MSNISDFAQVLSEALKDSEYKDYISIDLNKEEFDAYKDLSPKQVIEILAEKGQVPQKIAILKVLKDIYHLNLRGEKKYSMREKLLEYGLNFNTWLFFIRYGESNLKVDGEHLKTKYTWKSFKLPTFADAEEIYNAHQKMVDFKLTEAEKDIVNENVKLEFDEIVKKVGIKENEYKLGKLYQIKRRIGFKKSYNSILDKKNDPKNHVIFDKEISRTKIEKENINNEEEKTKNISAEEKNKNENFIINDGIKYHEIEKGLVFILNSKAQMYYEYSLTTLKYNELLEQHIKDLYEKINQLENAKE